MWSHADHLAGYAQQGKYKWKQWLNYLLLSYHFVYVFLDAHEFLMAVLDGIHSACEGAGKQI
jgi:hypothetical protein